MSLSNGGLQLSPPESSPPPHILAQGLAFKRQTQDDWDRRLGLSYQEEEVTTPLFEINPDHIRIAADVSVETMKYFQQKMSKAAWDWAVVTRQIGFVVRHHPTPLPPRSGGFADYRVGDLLGIFFLTSPVVNLGPRDRYLNMPKDPSERGKELRHYAEMSVCVAAQPIGWHWNLGKLLALLATTCGDFWKAKYGDELKGITTFSLWGHGTQYNRIFKYLGETQGHGHSHVTQEEYQTMRRWLRGHNISEFKRSPTNKKMHIINLYVRESKRLGLQAEGLEGKEFGTFHGTIRGIWYHPAQPPEKRREVIRGWYERWGRPRYERTRNEAPPYETGLGDDPKKGF